MVIRIISCKLENFASYKRLEFDFSDKGLTLIHGATGAGKSTLCDAVAWGLFNVTSKNGLADEVLPWTGGVTKAEIQVFTDKLITIHRTRGKNANDLYFVTVDGLLQRGKDLNDTQKLINNLLGINADLFLSGSYYHEFSQTAQFFQTTAKNRRAICEQLVDLSLAKKLTEKSSAEVKQVKTQLQSAQQNTNQTQYKIKTILAGIDREIARGLDWDKNHQRSIKILENKNTNFVTSQADLIASVQYKINTLETKPDKDFKLAMDAILVDLPPELEPCKECGTPKHNDKRVELLSTLSDIKRQQAENDEKCRLRSVWQERLEQLKSQKNTYLEQLQELERETNPYNSSIDTLQEDSDLETLKLLSLEHDTTKLQQTITDYDILSDVTNQFRSILIKNTILDIESHTNSLLSKHFDAELRIELNIEDSDKLEVSITKDGHVASFSQLSKGQRCMLKLCFGVAVMKAVANHHGVSFKQAWFDEALSGLDENLKLKACGLLQTLALDYDSVYFIEHSTEVQAMIDQKYTVQLIGGNSEITKD